LEAGKSTVTSISEASVIETQEKRLDYYRDLQVIFLHTLLFVYRGVVKNILGTGASIFDTPTFEAIMKILEEENIIEVHGNTIEEALTNYLKKLQDSGILKEARFERLSSRRYVLYIDKCTLASRLHNSLKPYLSSQICECALLAAPIFRKFSKKVKITPSDFTEEGAKTTVQL